MTQKWNLQDIRPVEPRQRRRSSTVKHSDPSGQSDVIDTKNGSEFEVLPSISINDGKKKSPRQLFVAIFIFVAVVGTGIGVSALTAGAVITLYPKVRDINVNAEFTALNTKKTDSLSYEIMTIDATGERQVTATGQEQVKSQATGEIEITKSTPGTERLIKNTRFATTDGLVFRIQESVVIPGAVKNETGEMVPGTVRAQVFADEAGENYNLPANTILSVPGFKEDDYTELYDSIKASNLMAFTDGFDGPKFIIDENELATAKQSLQMELRDTLVARVVSEKPANFTSFDSSIVITYTDLPSAQYGDTLVTIREQATLQIPLFKNADFASFIAKETIVGYDANESVRIDNLDTLTFLYSTASTSQTNLANIDSFTFKISGIPKIVWTVDQERMKVDLIGMEKTAFPGILGKYSGITKGEVKVRPFWKRSFPDKLDQIKIVEVLSTP